MISAISGSVSIKDFSSIYTDESVIFLKRLVDCTYIPVGLRESIGGGNTVGTVGSHFASDIV